MSVRAQGGRPGVDEEAKCGGSQGGGLSSNGSAICQWCCPQHQPTASYPPAWSVLWRRTRQPTAKRNPSVLQPPDKLGTGFMIVRRDVGGNIDRLAACAATKPEAYQADVFQVGAALLHASLPRQCAPFLPSLQSSSMFR